MTRFADLVVLFDGDEVVGNLSVCDYYLGVGSCSFGCYDEPSCFTCEPRGGWPRVERHPYAEFLLSARRLSYRLQNWSSWQRVRTMMSDG